MAFNPRTFNPAGSWIGTEHQQNLACLNTAERNRASLQSITPPSNHPYKYVRSTRFSASRFWREFVAQGQLSGVVKMPMSKPQKKMETLTFVSNFNHPHPSTTAGPLRFVGNFTLPAGALQAQVPCSVAQEGVNSLKVGPTWSTSSAPAGLPTAACSKIPIPSWSAAHYNPEELMEYHRAMASYYREKVRAEPVPKMEGSVCPKELPGNTGGIHGRAWDTWWEDADGIILPDDAVEKLEAIPGIWDLAVQMGFLTACEADN